MAVVPKCWQATKQASHRALCPLASSLICWFNARKMAGWLLWRKTHICPLGKLLFSSFKATQLSRRPGVDRAMVSQASSHKSGWNGLEWCFRRAPANQWLCPFNGHSERSISDCLLAWCVLCHKMALPYMFFTLQPMLLNGSCIKPPIFSVLFSCVACFLR